MSAQTDELAKTIRRLLVEFTEGRKAIEIGVGASGAKRIQIVEVKRTR